MTTPPAPLVWSPLEYAAHVRDVFAVFGERVELMRVEDGARFANGDLDAAAVEGRYREVDPAAVRADLARGFLHDLEHHVHDVAARTA